MKILLALLAVIPVFAGAQIISADRSATWSASGVKGGIPNRTKVCSALTSSNTLAQINSAIAACPAHQVVTLAAGTYNLSGGIIFNGKSNVTLRGAGPLSTILVFSSSNSCNGLGGNICVKATNSNDIDSPGTVTNWTAGYTKGTTTITLQSASGLSVGSIIMLDQLNDSTTDNNAIWMNMVVDVSCYDCASPGRGSGATERNQVQASRVTAINGNNVTIDPGVIWPNFTSGAKDPEAWFMSGTAVTGVGIENMTINTESGTGGASIFFASATDSWVQNVALIHCGQKCVWAYQSVGIDFSYNYVYDKRGTDASQEGSESYGFNSYLSTNSRVVQNIFHHITSALMCEAGVGNVYAYNYVFDDFYTVSDPDWFQASNYTHGACAYTLHEGNITQGMIQDIVHAPNYFHTAFRNRFTGYESPRTLQTVAVHIYAPNRYSNIIGNVLGDNSYHTQYESYPGSVGNCDQSIFALGFGGNCGNGTVANKTNVRTTLMRWGNYDTVNDASRFQSGEVPSGDANYPNSVPADNNLPASLFLTKKPRRWGNTVPWPAIGPDVTGGDIATLGGHAYSIPAKLCYDNTSKTGVQLTGFDANTCYGGTAGPTGVN